MAATYDKPRSVNALEYAGKDAAMEALRTDAATFFDLISDPADWTKPTPCTGWEMRDVVGHLVDVTECDLNGFDVARTGKTAAPPIGLADMAKTVDAAAKKFREVPRQEMIDRLRRDSDQMFAIFDGLNDQQWNNELVPHVFMGPLPTLFYPVFQLMDYSVHSWDLQQALGKPASLTDLSAAVLTPFMFILWQYTVDQARAAGSKVDCCIKVNGQYGGAWDVTVDNGAFSQQPSTDASDASATLTFEPSDFVLTAFQRVNAGSDAGDSAVAGKFRGLFFKI
jgi:uncharacterized protein (TIGR03083 family)